MSNLDFDGAKVVIFFNIPNVVRDFFLTIHHDGITFLAGASFSTDLGGG